MPNRFSGHRAPALSLPPAMPRSPSRSRSPSFSLPGACPPTLAAPAPAVPQFSPSKFKPTPSIYANTTQHIPLPLLPNVPPRLDGRRYSPSRPTAPTSAPPSRPVLALEQRVRHVVPGACARVFASAPESAVSSRTAASFVCYLTPTGPQCQLCDTTVHPLLVPL